ncbi:MAG: hypothetical protein KIS81_05155 [Maricaulaceae bacterium]|nr:hypothetical protein [Maricaulaceae bacterium]
MQYGEAFQSLGYHLAAPRTDWTATADHGVCVSLWEKELAWQQGRPYFDSRTCADPLPDWERKPGNRKRIDHLQHALDAFDGWVDVVIVKGNPKTGVDSAHPWKPEERQGFRWRVTHLDPATGHCALEVFPPAGD